jgi:hypothetical protein
MRSALIVGIVLSLVAATASAGVGVWTLAPRSSGTDVVVVGPGGALYVDCGAICKSLNHGRTWQTLNGPDLCLGFFCGQSLLTVDPSGAIYVANYGGGGGNVASALSVSRDSGATWTTLLPELFGTNSLRLLADPSTPGALFLLAGFNLSNGILYDGVPARSTDSGANWIWSDYPTFGGASVTAIALDPRTIGRRYAAVAGVSLFSGVVGPAGLYASSDGGATWTQSASNMPGAFVTMVVDPFHTSTVVGGGLTGIFRSTDSGQTFSTQSAAAVVQIVADPASSGRFYAAIPPNGVLTSSDDGATWTSMNTGLTDLAVSALALDASGGYLYAATNSGVFVLELALPTCQADAHTLCLNNGRFAVTADFQSTPEGPSAPATAVPLTTDTGYFWFFDPSNVEAIAKVLDGCSTNGHYWFFASGLTNVGVQINVTDTLTGAIKPYSNTLGTAFPPIQDTAAFPCP